MARSTLRWLSSRPSALRESRDPVLLDHPRPWVPDISLARNSGMTMLGSALDG